MLFPLLTQAQPFLSGRITENNTSGILSGVNLQNLQSGRHNVSDLGGNYKIPASLGDSKILPLFETKSSAGLVTAELVTD